MSKYTIGVDFGTASGRAAIVDVKTGKELADSTFEYPHGVMDDTLPDGTKLGFDWALQYPQDYLDVFYNTIPAVMKESGVSPDDVIGLGVDFTACTVLPVKKDGTPGNYTTIPNGCAGVENMYPYILSEANKGRISFEKAVEISATNPAKLFGIDSCKGAIEIGKDADIVVYDPKIKFVVKNAENQHGALDHTVWENAEFKGYPAAVYCRGKMVFDGKDFVGEKGYGKFIKQKFKNKKVFSAPEL